MIIKGLLQMAVAPGSRTLVTAEHTASAMMRKAWNKVVGHMEELYAGPEERVDTYRPLNIETSF